MSMTDLKISFPTEKLEALRFFMGKKEQNIEKELQDYLDKTYEKMVPVQLREYLESRIEQASIQQPEPTGQKAADQQQDSIAEQVPTKQRASETETEKADIAKERTARSTRRLKEQVATEPTSTHEALVETESPTEPEEGQGMSMSM